MSFSLISKKLLIQLLIKNFSLSYGLLASLVLYGVGSKTIFSIDSIMSALMVPLPPVCRCCLGFHRVVCLVPFSFSCTSMTYLITSISLPLIYLQLTPSLCYLLAPIMNLLNWCSHLFLIIMILASLLTPTSHFLNIITKSVLKPITCPIS